MFGDNKGIFEDNFRIEMILDILSLLRFFIYFKLY